MEDWLVTRGQGRRCPGTDRTSTVWLTAAESLWNWRMRIWIWTENLLHFPSTQFSPQSLCLCVMSGRWKYVYVNSNQPNSNIHILAVRNWSLYNNTAHRHSISLRERPCWTVEKIQSIQKTDRQLTSYFSGYVSFNDWFKLNDQSWIELKRWQKLWIETPHINIASLCQNNSGLKEQIVQ